ncbi:hypothetical protein KDA23_06140 [Candidatus Saccharibacteria bacterium]|nr:hypothetical protein [Candidatus Saccharibacteria bacterium]
MAEGLSTEQEMEVQTFALLLEVSSGPDDIFPPDCPQPAELRPLPRPNLPALHAALGKTCVLA